MTMQQRSIETRAHQQRQQDATRGCCIESVALMTTSQQQQNARGGCCTDPVALITTSGSCLLYLLLRRVWVSGTMMSCTP
jgi:hypothetical protein